MSEQSAMPALEGLESDYEIRGELRGTELARYYIGRAKADPAAEVAIMVVPASRNAENNALSHFAADAQIISRAGHPAIPRVLGSRWLGNDAVAVVSERILGETLDERLERGERFTNPRIAMLLQEVSAVLDWAREAGVVHRGVTPETIFFERGSNRARIALAPTPIPITGVPDACGDARTLGMLAWALLTGTSYAAGETRSLGDVCPNLATRVIEATDRMIRCKDHADAPDVGTFLGIVAAGDVLKQAEVELSAQKEEYDEQHAAAIKACELQREETEQHAAEQASILAGEREEFQRMMAEERAALEAERVQMESVMNERKERLAAVRAELDQQRAELERRVTELEQYRAEVERVRDEALAAREEAKAASARAAEAAAAHAAAVKTANAAAAAAAAASAAAALNTGDAALDTHRRPDIPEMPAATPDVPLAAALPPVAIPELEPLKAPKLAKPPKPPKWSRIEPVDLDHTDEDAVIADARARPRWMIPAGLATLVLVVVAVVYGAMHRPQSASDAVRIGNSTIVPTQPSTASGYVPRGGFLTQSAGGSVSPKLSTSPMLTPAESASAAAAAARTATGAAPVDSAALRLAREDSVAARARRAAAARAAAARIQEEWKHRAPTQREIDSVNAPPSTWNTAPPRPPVRDSAARRDTVVRRDSIRPDTTARRR